MLEDVYIFQAGESDLQEPTPKRPATDSESKIWGCLDDALTESNASVETSTVTEIDNIFLNH